MAYRGGFQTKAVGVDFKSLTDRYVEGKNAAEKSREIVRAERREQSLLLDDSASKIDATNVTEQISSPLYGVGKSKPGFGVLPITLCGSIDIPPNALSSINILCGQFILSPVDALTKIPAS